MKTLTPPAHDDKMPAPGPRSRWWGLPLLRAMRQDYLGFMVALHREHGDLCRMRLAWEEAWSLGSPALVREVLVEQADALVRWERGVEVFAQIFGQSVLTTEGEIWQRQRRMLQPAFTPRRVAAQAGLMRAAAAQALDAAVPPAQAEATVDMEALFARVTMDVILRTLFGAHADDASDRAIAATRTLSETAMREMFRPFSLPDGLPLPGKAAKRAAMHTLRTLVADEIAARRTRLGQPGDHTDDLLAGLLALRDEANGDAGLDETELFAQCMVTFQAGHDTSATALLWWSRLLASHPGAAARAQAEVDAVLAGRAPDPDDLARLPWLVATLKEALRLYPPIAALMTRRTTRPVRAGGHTIPRGAIVYVTPWLLQRDARSFPEPQAFQPERFMPAAPAAPRGAWIPFGLGPRVCIGQHFAMLEMTLVAAMLLQRFDLAWPNGAAAQGMTNLPALNVTLRPAAPTRLRLLRRRPGFRHA
ncbi:MAG: hypothetical protein RL654_3502 [Pseudomonadota bacterium]|jgi:cytochrome P450